MPLPHYKFAKFNRVGLNWCGDYVPSKVYESQPLLDAVVNFAEARPSSQLFNAPSSNLLPYSECSAGAAADTPIQRINRFGIDKILSA
jgi:hypothetical protein